MFEHFGLGIRYVNAHMTGRDKRSAVEAYLRDFRGDPIPSSPIRLRVSLGCWLIALGAKIAQLDKFYPETLDEAVSFS
jgi:hypothetical protein